MPARLTVADAAVALHTDWDAFQREVSTQGTAQARTAGQKITNALGPNGITRAFTAAGAAGTALFTGAIGGAVNFEDQLRTINTVAHLTDGELAGVGQSILDLSKETGKSTDDLTQGFYDLVSAGVPAKDAINVLRDSAKFATGALGTTADAVDLVTSAMNAYGLQTSDSTKITDVFAQAVADGKVTAAELGASIANIAPIAASAGIKLQEVAAGYAILTAKGVPAAQAATEMRAAISALLTPNAQLNELQKQTGVNFAELAKTQGLQVALERLRQATNGNDDAFAKALGSIEAYQFALASTGDNTAAYKAELEKTSGALTQGGIAQAQYDERMKSAKAQSDKMIASIHALAVEIGGPFVDTLGPAVAVVGQLGQGLHGLFLISSGLGGLLGRVLGGAWTRVAASGPIRAIIARAGSAAATAYLSALIAGDGLVGAISKAWQSVQRSSVVQGASSKAGSFLGSTLGKAASIAFAAVLVVEAVDTYNRIKGELAEQGRQIGTAVGHEIASGTLDELKASQAALEGGLSDLSGILDFGLFTGDAKANLTKQLEEVNAEIARRTAEAAKYTRDNGREAGLAFTGGVADGVQVGGPDVTKAWQSASAEAASRVGQQGAANWRRVGNLAGGAVSEGILAQRQRVDQAWQTFLDVLKNAETPTKERGRLLGELASKELVKGLHSGDPAVRAQAAETKQIIIDRLMALGASTKNIGKAGMEELRKAMKSKDRDIRAAATAIYNAAKKPIAGLPAAGAKAGTGMASGVATQIRNGTGPVGVAAADLARAASKKIILTLIAAGKSISSKGGLVAFDVGTPYVPYDQVAIVHQGERILTAAENRDVSTGAAYLGVAPAGGGDTYVTDIDVSLEAEPPARDPLDVARTLSWIAATRGFGRQSPPAPVRR